jgi:hypothetical protein
MQAAVLRVMNSLQKSRMESAPMAVRELIAMPFIIIIKAEDRIVKPSAHSFTGQQGFQTEN